MATLFLTVSFSSATFVWQHNRIKVHDAPQRVFTCMKGNSWLPAPVDPVRRVHTLGFSFWARIPLFIAYQIKKANKVNVYSYIIQCEVYLVKCFEHCCILSKRLWWMRGLVLLIFEFGWLGWCLLQVWFIVEVMLGVNFTCVWRERNWSSNCRDVSAKSFFQPQLTYYAVFCRYLSC